MGNPKEELENFLDGKESREGERIFLKWYTSFQEDTTESTSAEQLRRELEQIKSRSAKKRSGYQVYRMAATWLFLVATTVTVLLQWHQIQHWIHPTEWTTIIVPAGKKYQVTLVDGTAVWLNPNSTLRYPKQFGASRNVYLEGEGYFEVTHDEARPFIVTSGELNTQVLGTRFVVRAYPTAPQEVAVISGKVQVSRANSETKESVILTASMHVISKSGQPLQAEYNAAISAYKMWITGKFIFRDSPVDEIIQQLQYYYGVTIQLSSPSIARCRIQGTFDTQSLDNVLKILAASLQVNCSKTNNVYLLSGAGCP